MPTKPQEATGAGEKFGEMFAEGFGDALRKAVGGVGDLVDSSGNLVSDLIAQSAKELRAAEIALLIPAAMETASATDAGCLDGAYATY